MKLIKLFRPARRQGAVGTGPAGHVGDGVESAALDPAPRRGDDGAPSAQVPAGPANGPVPKVEVVRKALLVPIRPLAPGARAADVPPAWPQRKCPSCVAGAAHKDGRAVNLGPFGTFNKTMLPPTEAEHDLRQGAGHLPGRWIFGGLLRDHFGHVITNALGRLWVADHVRDAQGVVFLRDKDASAQSAIYAGLAEVLGLPQEHRIVSRPVVVDDLVVAPDLFSEIRECVADPFYNAWLDNRFPAGCMATRRVYVTRSRLDPLSGRLLCEDILEENFRAAGFEIFVPEQASLAEQVATYREAREIVSTDGSALHLAALVAGPQARVTIVLRRPRVHRIFTHHMLDRFGDRLNLVDAVTAHWFDKADKRKFAHSALAELDFAALRERLVADRLLGPKTPWKQPTRADITASCQLGRDTDTVFVRSRARI